MGAGAGARGRASSVSSRRSWAGIMQRFLKRVKEGWPAQNPPLAIPAVQVQRGASSSVGRIDRLRIERLLTGECSEWGREVVLRGMGVHVVAVVISLH